MIAFPLQTIPMQPESVLLVAGVVWIAAALATGLPHQRFPSEFPFMFSMIGFISAMVGVTELVPENIDMILTILGVILFAVTPVLITIKLYQSYPPLEKQAPPSPG